MYALVRHGVAALRGWLLAAAVITLMAGLIYVVGQQVLRGSANDPQIQMAEDTAAALSAGQAPEAVLPLGTVDVARSLAPYVVLFDASGLPVGGSGRLDGRLPSIPAGVFDYVRQHGEDRITWQPEPGVRSATVIVPVSGARAGFVLAGRSLREVENRVEGLSGLVAAGWLATLVAALVVAFGSDLLLSRAALAAAQDKSS